VTEGRFPRSAIALASLLGAAHLFAGLLFLRHGGQVKDFGWTAALRAGGREVASVDPAGPAAGRLAVGDHLLAVNGDLRIGRVWGLHFFAVKPGDVYTLRIGRGSEVKEVTLVVGRRLDPAEWWRGLPRLPLSLIWALLSLRLARRRGPHSGRLGLAAAAWSLVTLTAALPGVDLLSGVEYAGAILMINLSPFHLALAYRALTGLAGASGRLTTWVGAALVAAGGLLSLVGLVQRFTYLLAGPPAVIGFASDHPGLWEVRTGLMRVFGPAASVALLVTAARLRSAGPRSPEAWTVLLAGGLAAASALTLQAAAATLGTPATVALGLVSDATLLVAGLAATRARGTPVNAACS
jgi:hypothetical protein